MTSRKDYLKAVEIIKFSKSKKVLIEAFVEFFRGDNPKFNEEKFRNACQVIKGRIERYPQE